MFSKITNYRVPRNLLFLVNLMALILLFSYKKNNLDKFTVICSISLILIIYISNFILFRITTGDNYIFLIVTMLLSLGIIMIYRINSNVGAKQLIWIVIGIIVFFLSYLTIKKIKSWDKWLNIYIIASVLLFILTFVLGRTVKGSINWIRIGSFSFQPSEIIKLFFVFFIASYYSNLKKYYKGKISGYLVMLLVYVYIGFLFLQRDLGTALIFYLTFFSIQYVFEEDRKLIFYNILLAIGGAFLGYFLFSHVKIRVETWINPWKYVDNKGYQITQSLFAISNGGFFGTGVGLGYPDFIPEVHTDFIFSAICEEMGTFTGMAVIMLFLILVYRGFKIAFKQENKFFKIVSFGISCMFGFQTFIILGGVIKLIPLTGVTLPFVSYGGSSIIASFMALGVLQFASEEVDIKEVNEDG